MTKLNLRQTIILAVMCVVILYGAYEWLSPAAGGTTTGLTGNLEDKQVFLGKLTEELGKEEESRKAAYAVAMAETPWLKDPFLDSTRYPLWLQAKDAEAGGAPQEKLNFVYSGFVENRGRKMAIVNGDEYASGDKLLTNRHVLKSIDALKVVIQELSTGQEITVLFQE